MTRRPFVVVLAAALLLIPGTAFAQTGTSDTCGAAGFQGLVGQQARIAAMLILEQPKRVIRPGTIVTRDFRAERINFAVDDAGLITRVTCG